MHPIRRDTAGLVGERVGPEDGLKLSKRLAFRLPVRLPVLSQPLFAADKLGRRLPGLVVAFEIDRQDIGSADLEVVVPGQHFSAAFCLTFDLQHSCAPTLRDLKCDDQVATTLQGFRT